MSILRSDTFDRANGSLGTPSDAGSSWVEVANTWAINGNQAQYTGGITPGIAALESGQADVLVSAILPIRNANSCIGARIVDASNYLRLNVGTTGLTLRRVTSGVSTDLGSHSVTTNDTARYGIRCVGDQVSITIDGTIVAGPWTETQGQTETRHGLINSGTFSSARWDDFEIFGLASGELPAAALRNYRRNQLLMVE